ncbi:fasciclin domain-containing protein [Mucilaginibacter myungsuensis]|uniref:Fasciclin domain-containing protein n=1 Tax=Mucilaginibacter myungsuensis TaxID=649104 RepID=A0A929KX88_9SPHI|nr:fasciclin domain-containing protein [Mucilaginibacter myungsuensis]MBE9662155.1 fasciclin domain-containing protein [Mucilaginibacter myungsuensis]MDN3599411.1 fasciclin domain-containing protein [Mucilaginibacter myungsuensis]
MKKFILAAAATVLVTVTINQASAQTTDTTKKETTTTTATTTAANGAADVVGALNSNSDYTTAAAAVKTAGLEGTLKAGGPYTIFAPNNSAFSKLPQGAQDSLMKDPAKLATVLKGHVVSGKYGKAEIIAALKASKDRKVPLTTLGGEALTLSISPAQTLVLTNATGATAEVTLYDLVGGNGIVNGINGVLATK